MKKFLLLLTLALPMLMTTSCNDDENEQEPQKKIENRYADGIQFLEAQLFHYDEAGKVTGVTLGEFVMENEPTTAYVGVDSQEEAQQLASSLFPENTGVKMADNITFTLTDSLGVEQGKARYTASNTGESYGRLTFDDALGVDKKLLTSIIFIDNALWPANAPIGKEDISAGSIYKCSKEINVFVSNDQEPDIEYTHSTVWFICTRQGGNGQAGLLFGDLCRTTGVGVNFFNPQTCAERMTASYPCASTLNLIHLDMTGNNPIYWKQLAAIKNKKVSECKQAYYWTSDINYKGSGGDSACDDVKKVCLYTGATSWYDPPYTAYRDTWENAAVVYRFKTEDNQLKIWLDCNGHASDKQCAYNLKLSDLSKDRDMMTKAFNIDDTQ